MKCFMMTCGIVMVAFAPRPASQSPTTTRVVMLGTGTPRADPERSGPATAVVVNDAAYLVDAGPGIVRRAAAAAAKGIGALSVEKLQTLFITHLHSDHTVGLPDVIFTPWVQGRHVPLRVYGPRGTEQMTRDVLRAWKRDIDIRTRGLEHRGALEVQAHDVSPGVVFKDGHVTVTAFQNAHGEWDQTFGYKFQTADRTIVISGDTNPSDRLIAACQKCDVLIHEAYSENYRPADMPNWIEYRSRYHTTTNQLAEIANRTQPALLILYHRGQGSADEYISEIRRTYAGRVVAANDLDVY
jgi:ribonuclease BN (tRNA processing enzyme)